MKVLAGKSYKRVSLFAMSLVFAVSSFVAIAPQFFSQVAHAVSPTWTVNASSADGQCVVATRLCKTIQAAVDAASLGDTINVGAGMYAGSVTIPKGLTINGPNAGINPNDAGTPRVVEAIINNGNPAISINTTDPVTINGFTFDGTGAPISSGVGGTAPTITDNIIKNTSGGGNSDLFIQDATTLVLKDNQFSNLSPDANDGTRIIGSENGSIGTNVTIKGNVWENSPTQTGINATNIQGTVSGNTFSNLFGYALQISNNSSLTISSNTFSGILSDDPTLLSWGAGVRFYTPTFTQPVTITGNTFTGDAVGVASRDDTNVADLSEVTIHGNIFVGNTTGVYNAPKDSQLNATNNWWGDASGPSSVGSGTGDKVSTNINFTPWCTNNLCTTFSSASAITQDATNVNLYDATLNGTNGSYGADNTSFWWGTSSAGPFTAAADASSQFNSLSGWNHDAGLGGKAANDSFSKTLNSLTPNTKYYFVAWSQVNGTWYPGQVLNFTTNSIPVPTLVGPSGGAFVKSAGLILGWSDITGLSGATTYYYQSSYGSTVGANNGLTSTIFNKSTGAVSQIDASGTNNGTYYWQVKACDSLNNCSDWSGPWQVNVDNTVPNAPNNLSLKVTSTGVNIPNNSATNQSGLTASWNSNNSEPVTYLYESWYDNGSPYNQSNPWISPTSSTSYAGTFNQGPGLAHFCVVAVDRAGNKSNCSDATFNVTYDNAALTAPTNGTPDGLSTKNNFYFNWSPSTGSLAGWPVKYELIASQNQTAVENADMGVVWDSVRDGTNSGQGNLTTPTDHSTGAGDGVWYWSVRAFDAAGNQSPWSDVWSVTVDNNAPVIAVTGGNQTIEAGSTYTEQGATWTDNVDGSGDVSDITGTVNTMIPGDYAVTYSKTDTAGNTGTATRTVTVVDTTAPVITFAGITQNGNKFSSDITTDDANAVPTWTADPSNPSGATFDNTLVSPIFTLSNFGTYKYTLTVTDALGNPSKPQDVTFSYIAPLSVQLFQLATTTPLTTTTPQTTGTATNTGGGTVADTTGQVLGDQTSKANTTSDKGTVKGDSTTKNTDNTWKILGLAWYWWLLIVAVIAAVTWWIVAMLRRGSQNA